MHAARGITAGDVRRRIDEATDQADELHALNLFSAIEIIISVFYEFGR